MDQAVELQDELSKPTDAFTITQRADLADTVQRLDTECEVAGRDKLPLRMTDDQSDEFHSLPDHRWSYHAGIRLV